MANARKLHEITKALRSLQIRAVEAESPKAEAFIAMMAVAIRDMALEAEKDQPAQAQTVEELMQRLTDRRS